MSKPQFVGRRFGPEPYHKPSKASKKPKAKNLVIKYKRRLDAPVMSVNKRSRYVSANVEPARPRVSDLLRAQASAGPVAAAAAAGAAAAVAVNQFSADHGRPRYSPFYKAKMYRQEYEPQTTAFKVQYRK